jgi:hypothetical protein
MKNLIWIVLPGLLLPLSTHAETLEILSETLVNNAPIRVNLAPCSDYAVSKVYGTESDGDVINIYTNLYYAYFDLLPCFDSIVEIGPFASGSYTLNYYASRYGEAYELQDSKSIVIRKVAENDPPMGRIVLNGTPAEDQVINIERYEIVDANGVGDISFQWYRNDIPIPGAIYKAYILTDDDAFQDIRAVASYTDGLGNQEQFRSLAFGSPGDIANVPDSSSGSVYITGSFSTGSTLTLHNGYFDGDGVTFEYLWQHTLKRTGLEDPRLQYDGEPYTITDGDLGYRIYNVVTLDGDRQSRGGIVSNTSGEITTSRYAPVISLPDNIMVRATGVLTPVDPGVATAHDVQDGEIIPLLSTMESNGGDPVTVTSSQFDLPSGNHLLTWTATDSVGNTSEAAQLISIEPIIQFSNDYSYFYDDRYACPLSMSGLPAKYPVTVPYRLQGLLRGDSTEQLLFEGTLVIDGHEPVLEIPIYDVMLDDPTSVQSLRLEMGQVTNAVKGDFTSCEILIASESLSPRVSLTISQANQPNRILLRSKNRIVINTSISGINDGVDTEQASYEWNISDSSMIDIDTMEESFTINPTSLEPGLYKIGVTVNIGAYQSSDELSFLLVTKNPAVYSGDTDQDGEPDYPDSAGDSDQDGVPDYLDHSNLPNNVLQVTKADSIVLIKAYPGVDLFLGDTAFQALTYGALIEPGDIEQCGLPEICGQPDTAGLAYYAGLYNFQIKDLPDDGSSIDVVIPHLDPIEANSVYRVQTPSGWRTFLEDANNTVKSTTGSDRSCPAPRNESYQHGLREYSWCVELTLEDGGPNDADGQADGKIVFLGGAIIDTAGANNGSSAEEGGDSTTAGDGAESSGSGDTTSGGGGSLSPSPLLLLVLILGITKTNRMRHGSNIGC